MALKKKNTAWGQNGFEDWGGYMEAKKAKLEEQFNEEAKEEFKDASDLFKGIAIFVNGYTDPTADELRRLMMAHGGTYHHYLRPKITTHIIATNLPYSKIMLYKKVQCPFPICKPEWITDSIKAGKVLNYSKYLLHTNCTGNQPQLNFKINEKSNSINDNANRKNNAIQSINSVVSNNVVISNGSNENGENREEKSSRTRGTALSSKNSEFISEFYNNSRLHHIATMSATFKNYVNELRDKSDGKFPGLELLKELKESKRPDSQHSDDLYLSQDEMFSPQENQNTQIKQEPIIMHIDMDCFFVSVGLRSRPHLRGLPVAVAHAKGNKKGSDTKSNNTNDNEQDEEECGSLSEVASCSYEARKAGVRNGMVLGQALKICPDLHTIKYDFEAYKEVSYTLYDTVASYTLDIEAVSCDEMYADCTKVLEESRLTPMEFAKIIRDEIRQKTGCPVSTGFGSNKLRARLATKKAKPNGQLYLEDSNVISYIDTFNVQDLPGVGYTTTQKLNGMNINTCAQLRSIPLRTLQKDFGKKMGELLYNMCRGIDKTKLHLEHIRKSVSADVNYGIRFENNGEAVDFLKKLCDEVHNRLKKANAKGRCITLKLMVKAKEAPVETLKFMGHGPCDYITKSKNLIASVDDLAIITREIISLWNQLHQKPEDMRGIGIQISRLEMQTKGTNDNTLLNFINKTKESRIIQCNTIERKNDQSGENTKNKDLKTFFTSKGPTCTKNSTDLNTDTTENIKADPVETLSINNDKADSRKDLSKTTVVPSLDRSIILLPSQDIHDSILNELPEEIRSEILEAKKKMQKSSDNTSKVEVKIDKNKKVDPEVNNSERNNQGENSKAQNTATNIVQSQNSVIKKSSNKNINQNDVKHSTSEQGESAKDTCKDFILSQEIDESTLNELPDNIRTEIIGTMLRDKNKAMKSTQTRQEQFFKQIKPNSGRVTKTELPPIQEIDMSVLLELPEDIRNEIFNQYKSNTHRNIDSTNASVSNEKTNERMSVKDTKESVEPSTTIENITFSQVDPDFLAALPTDMQYDVQQYCIAKKKENRVKDNLPNKSTVVNKSTKKWTVLQYDKNARPLSKSKNNGKNSKTVTNKNNRNKKDVKPLSKAKERGNGYELDTIKKNDNLTKTKSDNKGDNVIGPSTSGTNNIDYRKEIVDESDAILAHNINIANSDQNTEEYRNTLVNIVNHLLSLPLESVKMQMQTWIAKSDAVNEVDFSSFATFLSMLPEKKRIEDLHVLLKAMHRYTTKTENCAWHRTYDKTVKHVQHYMQIEYNSVLMVPEIKCNCLEYNNDVI
ncbi:hypothetical protein KPH14_011266 [Odynerus spinipes]|uniref:DNA repair protein REV1 n=1 Tax=Odynerus spinipes TaxID=1348599 RepID=A0AAD9R9F2_9HYME|nr:hypothetical protein KPH14_011266 [Odynerus spinipes]